MLLAKPVFEVLPVDHATVSATLDRLPASSSPSPITQKSCEADDHAWSLLRKDKRNKRTNKFGLTERQTEVLQQLAVGLSNKEIGRNIGLAEGTVKIHVATIFQALHVNKRMDAVKVAQRIGLLAPDDQES